MKTIVTSLAEGRELGGAAHTLHAEGLRFGPQRLRLMVPGRI